MHSPECLQINVEPSACYLRFGPQKVAGALALRWETVREESLVIDLTKDGQIVGIEIFKPGMKPCQPEWVHQKPWDPENKLSVEPIPPTKPESEDDDEEEDPEGGAAKGEKTK